MRRSSYFILFAFTVLCLHSTALRALPADSRVEPGKAVLPFDFSLMNKVMLEEFGNAWGISKNGTIGSEGVVLAYANPDGSYRVRGLRPSNEFQRFTFQWEEGIIAVFHTHSRGVDPRPSNDDIIVADRHNVLMFTLTLRGMYVYDPQTRKTSLVMCGLDWLNAAKWTDKLSMQMAAVSPSFTSKLIASGSR